MAQLPGRLDRQDDLLGTPGGPIEAVPESKWARNLVALIEVAEARLKQRGMDDGAAFSWARELVLAQAEYCGGRQIYLPTGDALLTAMKHAEIYRRANRDNILALAQEYGLTDSQIYRICREQKRLHLDKMQGKLFDQGEQT